MKKSVTSTVGGPARAGCMWLGSLAMVWLASSAVAAPCQFRGNHGRPWVAMGPFVWEAEHSETEEGDHPEAGEVMEGSASCVRRNPKSVEGRVRATELTPGHVYTLHVVVFNNPDACTLSTQPGFKCGFFDLFNPATGGSFMWGDGKRAARSTVDFRVHRNIEDTSRIWLGSSAGITNPAGAEISFDLSDMGLPIAGHLRDQMTSARFGCGPGEPNDAHNFGFCKDAAGNAM